MFVGNISHIYSVFFVFALLNGFRVAQSVPVPAKEDQLILAQVIWRHGDRAPISQNQYPNNPNKEELWPYGWSELTQLGMQQQFALGQILRKRYILSNPSLLDARYNPKQIYIRSTDVNRTLLSAMSNLAGMFSADEVGEDFPSSSPWPNGWTPIPVHTVPERTDHVGNILADCARAVQLHKFIDTSEEFRRIAHENRGFFKYVSEMSGKDCNLANVNEITDVIYCETTHNLTQPAWISPSVLAQLRNLTNLSNQFFHGISKPYVPELIRIRGGNLLKELTERMKFKIDCETFEKRRDSECQWIKQLKYYAYSAHDTTVVALLSTFGEEERVIPGGMPHYTASLAIELWNTRDKGPAVKVLYLSSSNHDYRVITDLTKGCPQGEEFCPLKTFEARGRKFMPENIDEECRAK